MADTADFFATYLPQKLSENPGLAKEINAIYQFDIDGAGTWSIDLTGDGTVAEGAHDNPGCTVTVGKDDFEGLHDGSKNAMTLFITGKLAVTNPGLAMSLQKILS